MYTNEELEKIYDERYKDGETTVNKREISLYSKLRRMLLPTTFLQGEINQLDLGCGRGHKTIGFSSSFSKVVAIDLSENVIAHCKTFYGNYKNVAFVAGDATKVDGKFNLITAFGFSLFNTADNKQFLTVLDSFVETNLKLDTKAYFIVGSFTDFSGGGEESWYLHTKEDLDFLKREIEGRDMSVKIIFPHKMARNYFGAGFYNFVAESIKLLTKRKRTFFIVIEHG